LALIKRGSLGDQVAEAILELVQKRGLSAGDPLPSTAELSESFGVSRTVVREALADLAGRGVVDRSQGREPVLTVPGTLQLQGLFGFHLKQNAVTGDELTEFRVAVEAMSARLGAARRTPEQVQAMQDAVERMKAAKSNSAFHEADIAFHQALAQSSENLLIALVLDALVGLLREFRLRWFAGQKRHGRTFAVVAAEHQAILDAVAAGDSEAAATAMATHLAASREDLDAVS
jgi:GntR family transcriptional repressor for pyruvate dehydrogenase complex